FFDRRDCAYPTGQNPHHVRGMNIIPRGIDISRVVTMQMNTMNPPTDASLSWETRNGFFPRRTMRNITPITPAIASLKAVVLSIPGIFEFFDILYPLQIKWKFEKHGIFANASFSGVITKHSRYVNRKIEIIE
ncbi:MAG: hypothetical protein Q8O46_03255, partial [bacterium]|nr:hypothetical protein [bacterium]